MGNDSTAPYIVFTSTTSATYHLTVQGQRRGCSWESSGYVMGRPCGGGYPGYPYP